MQVEKTAELKGHKGAVYALSESLQPNLILSGGSDQYLVQWNLDHPEEAFAIAKLPGIIYGIFYLRNKKQVLVGDAHGGIHIIDVERKALLKSAPLHKGPVFDIKLLPGEKSFASVGGDGMLVISGLSDLSLIKRMHLCEEKIRGIDIHPNAKEMAVACGDGTIRIIDLFDFTEKYELEGHEKSVYAVKYDSKNNVLLSGARDAHLNVWDIENNYQLLKSIPAHNYAIYDIQFSKDGKYFATSSRDKTFKIWDAETQQVLIRVSKDNHQGHAHSVNVLYWSPYTGQIISAGDDKNLMVWALAGD